MIMEPNKAHSQNTTDSSSETVARNCHDDASTAPHVGMEFETEDAAKTFYDAYAKRLGFSTNVGQFSRSKPDGPIVTWEFTCTKQVRKRKNIEGCRAMLRIERKDSYIWEVTKFTEAHNHSLASAKKVHQILPRRQIAGAINNVAETEEGTGDANVSVDGNHGTCQPSHVRSSSPAEPTQPVWNVVTPPVYYPNPPNRKRTLGVDAHNLLNYFQKMQAENPGFYYAIQLDKDNCMTNVFWADARSRMAYNHFGDAVVFDTMYRPNRYLVPFAPFTGVNHHGQMVLFGCALLLDASESSFTWLFRTWLSAMNSQPPVSFTTDQDRAIQMAVKEVFPGTCHCICKWHILREGQERLAPVYLAHPSLYGELYSCINSSETIDEFELSWTSLLDKYVLQSNEWLQAVYNARKQWAPVYFRGTFFAALYSSQGVSTFFDGYVNQQTTIPLFFQQYERALLYSLEKEIEADFDTISSCSLLKTPSPMEQQAANLYTKKVFVKFQEELVETFAHTANKVEEDGVVSKFRVEKYEQNDKVYVVTLNMSNTKARCSCQMFEHCGILCRHILTVFTVTNILTLPSHYVLKRWTRNAKLSAGLEEQNSNPQSIDSFISRFNNLCLEAMKYAEEGAIATETYDVAISALKESAKKIASVRNHVAKVRPISFQGTRHTQEDNNKETPSSVPEPAPSFPEVAPSFWPWQEAIQPQFNLNVVGGAAMGYIPRDGGSFSNTVVMTYFKSMKWVIENKTSTYAGRVAVINLKLHDYGKNPPGDTDVQFRLTKANLEPMLQSMGYISQQLSTPANQVAIINLKLQNTKTTTGETVVKFQVSRDTLGSMLTSMAYIREQL